MSDTTRIDKVANESISAVCETGCQLERELSEVTKQRDEWFEVYTRTLKKLGDAREQIAEVKKQRGQLADLLEKVLEIYVHTCPLQARIIAALAAVKGGEA